MDAWEPFYLAIAVTALLVAIVALMRWRRAVRLMGTRVLIGEAMKRRGITPADAEAAGLEPETLLAGRRCATCASDSACRVLLSELGQGDVPGACPNREFFDRVSEYKAVRASQDSLST
jgi:hypothetical protein